MFRMAHDLPLSVRELCLQSIISRLENLPDGRALLRMADRTCSKAAANQFRLFLHAGVCRMMWGLRVSMPKRSVWGVAQFDTLRSRFPRLRHLSAGSAAPHFRTLPSTPNLLHSDLRLAAGERSVHAWCRADKKSRAP
jgi:hypothetical protein